MAKRVAHGIQVRYLGLDLCKMISRDPFDVGAGTCFALIEGQQGATVFDCEPQFTGTSQKAKLMHVLFAKPTISVVVAHRFDQVDILVIPDGFGWKTGAV